MRNFSFLLLPLFLILSHPIHIASCENGTSFEGQSGDGSTSCSQPGYYYNNSTDICVIGRHFGGILFFDEGTTSTYSALTRDALISEADAESIVSRIYSSSDYYVESNVITCSNISGSGAQCSYELIYENAAGVNTDLIESDFNSGTGDCSDTFADDFNCTKSRDQGLGDQSILCDDGGVFYGECDSNTEAKCIVSDSGSFYCNCSDQYALPYDGATSCSVIKCKYDSDCSGGGIHGSCKVNNDSSAYNSCQCNWGFTGNNCEDPWWFVFTVLTGAFGLLAIALLVACICMTTKTKTVKNDIQKDDLDLKNPFVDFQPGVRAKVSTNIYSSVTDSISAPTTQGHSNPAFNNNAYDEREKATPYSAAAQGNDYF